MCAIAPTENAACLDAIELSTRRFGMSNHEETFEVKRLRFIT